MAIIVTDTGVSIPLGTEHKEIRWNDILEIHAYKKDLLTTDVICIDLILKESVLTINEEIYGWDTFLINMQEVFTGIDKNWWQNVAFPAFATNYVILYKRGACK